MLARLSLRSQLLLALVVPAAVVVAVVAARAEAVAASALEAALGQRLVSVAQAAAILVSPRITVLGPGDDATRTHRSAVARLLELSEATAVARLLVVRAEDDSVLLDTGGELPVGAPYRRADFDRLEIEQVQAGLGVASVLFEGPSGRPFKSGYAPLRADREPPARGSLGLGAQTPEAQAATDLPEPPSLAAKAPEVVAYVVAVAPATYTDALVSLRERVGFLASGGLVLLGTLAVIVAGLLSRPLARLSEAARAVGGGRLDVPVPSGGPAEAIVLAETMRTMTRSLEARDEEMQMMLAGIAHEVRNPLGGIELFGGLLREDLEGDPRQSHVVKILRELGVLSRVVNDFLDFARRKPLRPTLVDVRDLVEEVAGLAKADLDERDITLELGPTSPTPALLDREAIQRALLNLIRNAIQAAPRGGRVRLGSQAANAGLELSVDDDGPGVAPDKVEAIFAPFFTTKQKGTGLGLALVRRTALAHGGTVRVERSPLGGARFVLELPLAEPDARQAPGMWRSPI